MRHKSIHRYSQNNRNRNRNLKTSKALLKSQAHQGPAYSRALRRIKERFSKGGQEKLRSDFQNTRRDRVAVKVGVVQVEMMNNQLGQGRSVGREDMLILNGRPWG